MLRIKHSPSKKRRSPLASISSGSTVAKPIAARIPSMPLSMSVASMVSVIGSITNAPAVCSSWAACSTVPRRVGSHLVASMRRARDVETAGTERGELVVNFTQEEDRHLQAVRVWAESSAVARRFSAFVGPPMRVKVPDRV
jgi:hypothetical protein